jgi:hypothetical protein
MLLYVHNFHLHFIYSMVLRPPSAYSSRERTKLNSYKEEYLAFQTSAERTDFLKKKLAPEFFNWRKAELGTDIGRPDSPESKAAITVCSMLH